MAAATAHASKTSRREAEWSLAPDGGLHNSKWPHWVPSSAKYEGRTPNARPGLLENAVHTVHDGVIPRESHRSPLGSGVFGINKQIRIRFSSSRKLFFLNDSNFWCVQGSITHSGRTCACAVACLHPHNSIPNVVVSVTIHDDTDVNINLKRYRDM